MSHATAKPKTAVGGVVEVLIAPNNQGTNAQNKFKISVASASLGFSVQVADVTADADTVAVYTHNQMTRGTFQVQGYALGASAAKIGIANLQSTDNGRTQTTATGAIPNGPTGFNKYDIRFNWANGKSIYGIGIIEQIQISYSRTSPFVGVSLAGRFTSTDLGSAAVADGAYG